jgi:hypothetical protein
VIILPAARGFIGGAQAWGPRTALSARHSTGSVVFSGLIIPVGALVAIGVADQSATSAMGVVSDTSGNTWNNTGWTDNSAGGCSIFWSRITNLLVGGTITATARSGSTSIMSAGGMWAAGAAPSPYDAAAYATAANSGTVAPTITSGTPSGPGRLFFAFWAGPSNVTTPTCDPAWEDDGFVTGTSTNVLPFTAGSRVNAVASAVTFTPVLSAIKLGRANIAAFHL